MTKKLRVRLEDRGHGDFTVHLPALPPGMDGMHEVIFHNGDRVIFGLMIWRYEDGSVNVGLCDPDIADPVYSHEFKEKDGEGKEEA